MHCQVLNKEDNNFAIDGVKLFNYDYASLMHYGQITGSLEFEKNKELVKLADKSESFSAGDVACIKIIYSKKGTHHGEWHEQCKKGCSDYSCSCGACGKIRGLTNCGYQGKLGHYTCCMSEEKNSMCLTTHSGFWHAKCVNLKCTSKVCTCYNCGGGCTYEGN